jgi:hypothetical protein
MSSLAGTGYVCHHLSSLWHQMDAIGTFVIHILLGLATTAICKGLLGVLRRRYNLRPEKMVAVMIKTITMKVVEENWIGWILSGFAGIILVVVWDVFHVNNILENWWEPPAALHADALTLLHSDTAADAAILAMPPGILVPVFMHVRFYNTTRDPITPKTLEISVRRHYQMSWTRTCIIDTQGLRLFIRSPPIEILPDNNLPNNFLGHPIQAAASVEGWVGLGCADNCQQIDFVKIKVIDLGDASSTTTTMVPAGSDVQSGALAMWNRMHIAVTSQQLPTKNLIDPCTHRLVQ